MFEDMDLELEEPVEVEAEEAGERQNRTFIILVAVMGGLLLIGIIAFCAWLFTVGRGIIFGGQAVVPPTATPEEVVMAAETATAEPTATPVPSPTATPAPSPTPPPTIAAQPATPTPQVTATPGGTRPTPVPTDTPTVMVQTGLGAYTALILAAGLLVLLVISRRLRTVTRGR